MPSYLLSAHLSYASLSHGPTLPHPPLHLVHVSDQSAAISPILGTAAAYLGFIFVFTFWFSKCTWHRGGAQSNWQSWVSETDEWPWQRYSRCVRSPAPPTPEGAGRRASRSWRREANVCLWLWCLPAYLTYEGWSCSQTTGLEWKGKERLWRPLPRP